MEVSESERLPPLPANYVSLNQLKERYLKEKEREQKEREEKERLQREKEAEELRRLQKEKEEEEAKLQRQRYDVVAKRRSNRRESRPVVVDRNVSEVAEEPEEKISKKKKKWLKNTKKNCKAEANEEECAEKASSGLQRNGGRRRTGVLSLNCEEIEPKLRELSVIGETGGGDERVSRPSSRNVGAKDEIKLKVRDLGMNGETGRGNGWWKKSSKRSVVAKGNIEPKLLDFSMNGEIERQEGRLMGANSSNVDLEEAIDSKVGDNLINGETEREKDRRRGPNRKHESEPKIWELWMNGERKGEDNRLVGGNKKEESEPKVWDLPTSVDSAGGEDRLWRPKGKIVDGKDETVLKVRGLSVKSETERGDEKMRMPSRFDYRSKGMTWGYKKEKQNQWNSLAWVKKGELYDGNVGGVQSSEQSISGKDTTNELEDAGHSKSANELMETMCIIEFDSYTSSSAKIEQQPTGCQKLMDLTKQYRAVPAVVVGISMVVGSLYMRKK